MRKYLKKKATQYLESNLPQAAAALNANSAPSNPLNPGFNDSTIPYAQLDPTQYLNNFAQAAAGFNVNNVPSNPLYVAFNGSNNAFAQPAASYVPPQPTNHLFQVPTGTPTPVPTPNPVAYNAVGAPPPPPGSHVVCASGASSNNADVIYPSELLAQIPNRTHSAHAKLGHTASLEARKGLSRVLDARAPHDLEKFGEQLRKSDIAAVEENWRKEDHVPIFAVTYVQCNPPVGRFKFNKEQWDSFKYIAQNLARAGVNHFRLWLDQCLWIRDASQQAWAHTGLLPYTMWPVICLGKKQVDSDKSLESRERMWPFVKEVAGLWGMGVLFGREMRSKDERNGWRWWPSCQRRERNEPEDVMMILLLNIFHGAADKLETGWKDDVIELGEMATANIFTSSADLFVGSDWRQRIAREGQKDLYSVMNTIVLPCQWNMGLPGMEKFFNQANIYLDGSRTLMIERWGGLKEWLSGHGDGEMDAEWMMITYMNVGKLNVRTNIGEFQILTFGQETKLIRLLVAMDGVTSNFSRGKVAWTKVMTGIGSCQVSSVVQANNSLALGHILSAELCSIIKSSLIRGLDCHIYMLDACAFIC